MDLRGKNALITGGAVRIGRALTLALAEAGCDVLIHYGRSEAAAKETQTVAKTHGVRAVILTADLSNSQETQILVQNTREQMGPIDVLINNAAIFVETDTFQDLDLALWENIFNINLRAPFLLSQAFSDQLPEGTQGKIINVIDARIHHPATDHFAYRLTKGALQQMTEMMAIELAPRIAVNAVALGAILPPPGADQIHLENIAQARVPLKRAGSAEIVAENVLHLLRQDFLTGVTIPIDGGEFL